MIFINLPLGFSMARTVIKHQGNKPQHFIDFGFQFQVVDSESIYIN